MDNMIYEGDIMKKDYLGKLAFLPLTALMLCACASTSVDTEQVSEDSTTKQTAEEDDASFISTEEETVFSRFAIGTGYATIDEGYRDDGTFISVRDSLNAEFTIKDMISVIKENYPLEDISESAVDYRLIDCGNDGVEDMVLKLSFDATDNYVGIFVFVCDENGNLKLCYGNDEYSNKRVSINDCGFFRVTKSTGYTSFVGNTFAIDSEGDYKKVSDYEAINFADSFSDADKYETSRNLEQAMSDWMEKKANADSSEKCPDVIIERMILDNVDYYLCTGYDLTITNEFIDFCTDGYGIQFITEDDLSAITEEALANMDMTEIAESETDVFAPEDEDEEEEHY